MTTRPFRTQELQGFQPAVEPTRASAIFVLTGKNYRFDVLGPISSFGNRFLSPHVLPDPSHVQGVEIPVRGGDRSFTFTNDSIKEWSEELGTWEYIYLLPSTAAAPNRWTWVYLGQKIFFCHPAVGILVLDIDTNLCVYLDENAGGIGIPDDPIAICENNGHLCVLTSTLMAWSAPSDGTDFEPRVGGAGFQTLAGRVSGFPITITPYGGGVITWTTGGIMRSQFAGGVEVFRHRALKNSAGLRPANSFCSVQVSDDVTVILDKRGLYKTSGEEPEPYTPLFNEYLIRYLEKFNFDIGNNLRLEWDHNERLLYVSVSLSRYNPIYEKCFVLNPAVDKWGQFNDSHYGILPMNLSTGNREGKYVSYVDSAGLIRNWLETGSREIPPTDTSVNLKLGYTQMPVRLTADRLGRVSSSVGQATGYNPTIHTARDSWYPADGNTPEEPVLTGLDSYIQMGLFRLSESEFSDAMSEVLALHIRSNESGDADVVVEDWTLVPDGVSDEDFTLGTGVTDYGYERLNYVNHELTVIGTVDGKSVFASEEPELVRFNTAGRNFSCSVAGIWHIIEMRAESIGQGFRPLTLEITATDAGQYT